MVRWKPIPGETPIDDISGLKIKGITTRGQLNEAEANNILKAVTKYYLGPLTTKLAPFDFSWAIHLHEEMFGDVWKWAGKLRKTNLNLGCDWQHVETKLYDLLQNLPYWIDLSQMEQACRLHHLAVQIHPFMNGNGRWSRMLANIWLRLHGQGYIHWPEGGVGTESPIRALYLTAIKAADNGDYISLLALHQQYHSPE